MKILLEINEEQARVLKNALELYGRIGMGEVRELIEHPSFRDRNFDRHRVKECMDEIKKMSSWIWKHKVNTTALEI